MPAPIVVGAAAAAAKLLARKMAKDSAKKAVKKAVKTTKKTKPLAEPKSTVKVKPAAKTKGNPADVNKFDYQVKQSEIRSSDPAKASPKRKTQILGRRKDIPAGSRMTNKLREEIKARDKKPTIKINSAPKKSK